MVEAHEVEDGGMQVVDMDGVFDRLETEVIGGTVHRTPLSHCHIFNQRSVAGILQMIRMVGGLIDCADKADALISRLETGLGALRLQTEK